MNLSKQIKAFRDQRAEKAARQAALLKMAADDADGSRTLNDTESQEFDAIELEVKSIDQHVARLEKQLQVEADKATEPNGDPDKYDRQTVVVKSSVPEQEFKGQTYIRTVKSKAIAKLDGIPLREVAEHMYGKAWGQTIVKSASPIIAADVPKVPVQDFVEILRADSLYDTLSFRHASPYIPYAIQNVSATAAFIGEGAAITPSKWGATTNTLVPHKVASLVPATMESLRDNTVRADQQLLTDAVGAIRNKVDAILLGNASSETYQPAGLFYNVVTLVSGGVDWDDVIADVKGLVNVIAVANPLQTGQISLAMNPRLAADIGNIRTDLGITVFPGISVSGGNLEGYPVRVSTGVPYGKLFALIESEVYSIGDQGIEIAISTEASIDTTSMFETGMVAFRVIRPVAWAKRRAGISAWITTVAYGPSGSGT